MIQIRARRWLSYPVLLSIAASFALVVGMNQSSADTATGPTDRASVADSTLAQGNGQSNDFRPAISEDGTKVAFASLANNLVTGDTNGKRDVFIHDFSTDSTTRISITSAGAQQTTGDCYRPAFSADTTKVVFYCDGSLVGATDNNGKNDVYLWDSTNPTTVQLVSRKGSGFAGGVCTTGGPLANHDPEISGDGNIVAWETDCPLVSGDTNGQQDIYAKDMTTGTLSRANVNGSGAQGTGGGTVAAHDPDLSYNGGCVAFFSAQTNLVGSDTNGVPDSFVRNRISGRTFRVSVNTAGTQGNQRSYEGHLSDNCQFAAFHSFATNLVSGDTNRKSDIFIRDLVNKTTKRLSVSTGGNQANNDSKIPVISADGRYVAWYSTASNLVSGDTNGTADVFVRDRTNNTTKRASISTTGTQGNGGSTGCAISHGGAQVWVAFQSNASNLVTGDTNTFQDVFRHEFL
jgi:Tol biopolymer transport system component